MDDQLTRNDHRHVGDASKQHGRGIRNGGNENVSERGTRFTNMDRQPSRNNSHFVEEDPFNVERDIGDRRLRLSYDMSGRSARSSNSLDHLSEENIRNGSHRLEDGRMIATSDGESERNGSPRIEDVTTQSSKRKRMNKFGRVAMCLEAHEVADAREIEEHVNEPEDFDEHDEYARRSGGHGSGHSANNGSPENAEATSKVPKKGFRGKYKAYVVDMKLKGQKSKLEINIPDEIDRAIGDNARNLVNECGHLVRTRAPLNVKSWKEAIAIAGDSMWKEIEDKFEVRDGTTLLRMQVFVIDTMQRLYRLWKARLHTYYKSKACGKTDEERLRNPSPDLPQDQWEYCVKRFGSLDFKVILSYNFFFLHLILHFFFKVVLTYGDSKTQEEILLDVLEPRSGYFHGKGIVIRPYTKDRLQQQKLVEKQQDKIQEQVVRIHELEKSREQQ